MLALAHLEATGEFSMALCRGNAKIRLRLCRAVALSSFFLRCSKLRLTRRKIYEQTIRIGNRVFADFTAVNVFLCDVSKNAAGQFFRR